MRERHRLLCVEMRGRLKELEKPFVGLRMAFKAPKVKNRTYKIKALELNTGAYNKCLFSKVGEKYSAEDLKACQSHYLNEVERLSYVFKNICK